jgi:hypothetical protein
LYKQPQLLFMPDATRLRGACVVLPQSHTQGSCCLPMLTTSSARHPKVSLPYRTMPDFFQTCSAQLPHVGVLFAKVFHLTKTSLGFPQEQTHATNFLEKRDFGSLSGFIGFNIVALGSLSNTVQWKRPYICNIPRCGL